MMPGIWRMRLASVLPQPAVGTITAFSGVLSLIMAWRLTTPPLPDSTALLLTLVLSGAGVAAYFFHIHIRHQTKISLVTLVYYLLAVLVPPPLAALGAGLAALTGEVARRSVSGAYPSDIASEVGRRILIVLVGAVVAHIGGGPVPTPAALLGAAGVLGFLDALSLPLVLAPIAGEPPWLVFKASLREIAGAESILYAVGIIGAVAATRYLWTLGLLVVPCALVYIAFKTRKELQEGTRLLLEHMADAVDLRDPYTGGHSRRVAEYSAAILRALEYTGPEVALIVTAARVHDIGKIGVPDLILNKPGKLTPEERAVLEEHPVKGADFLKRHEDFTRGIGMVRHHHESWDGTGYPDRLKGAEIPFGARVIAVADSYDAMTSDRPYRQGMPAPTAAMILHGGRRQQWDPQVVDAFLRTIPGAIEVLQAVPPPHLMHSESTTVLH